MSAVSGARRKPRTGSAATTRLRKVECTGCGYVVRMSRSWMAVGLPTCPNPACDGGQMSCADPGDAVELGYLSLDDLPRTVRTAICRANGWEDDIIRTSGRSMHLAHRPDLASGPVRGLQPQCAEPGCGCYVKTGHTHCGRHGEAEIPF